MNTNSNINSQPQQPVLKSEVLLKEKAQPFGAHFLVKLDEVNYKLTCSLSFSFFSDIMTDWYGR